MPTYAVLGATGQTGSEIVRYLLPTSNHINVYARSGSRLAAKHPTLESAANVTTFIGELDDADLLAKCLCDADIVLSAVAQNRNEPGCSIAQRTARSIVHALEQSREDRSCPTVVFLSSSALNEQWNAEIPWFVKWLLHSANHHVYTDLKKAIAYLQTYEWLPLVQAEPGGLVHHPLTGVILSDTEHSMMVPYSDLARAMVMMAEDRKWIGQEVSMVVNEGRPVQANAGALLRYLVPGLLGTFCPPLWRLGRNWWP